MRVVHTKISKTVHSGFLKEEEKRLAALKVQQEKLTLAKEQTDETMAIKKLKNKRVPKQPAASS